MMAPPKTFAPAAVNPSSKLVRMGDMRKKNIRLRAVHGLPVETRLAASGLAAETGQSPSLHQILLLRFGRRGNHVKSHAALATTHRMAGLRRVLDHPRLLADDPP